MRDVIPTANGGKRILKASCPEGGVVLDCFAVCAYVAVAAERAGRDWLACDINPRSWTIYKHQFSKSKLATLTCAEPTHNAPPALIGNEATVHGSHEPPKDTIRTEPALATLKPPKPTGWGRPASIILQLQMLEFLLDISDYTAWCCGFANRMPDGTVVRTTNNFHLDHLDPKSDETAKNGELMVSDVSELIDLDYAFQRTLDIYSAQLAQERAA